MKFIRQINPVHTVNKTFENGDLNTADRNLAKSESFTTQRIHGNSVSCTQFCRGYSL